MAYIDSSTGGLLSNAKSESYGGLIDTARSVIQASRVIGPLRKQDAVRSAISRAEDRGW